MQSTTSTITLETGYSVMMLLSYLWLIVPSALAVWFLLLFRRFVRAVEILSERRE